MKPHTDLSEMKEASEAIVKKYLEDARKVIFKKQLEVVKELQKLKNEYEKQKSIKQTAKAQQLNEKIQELVQSRNAFQNKLASINKQTEEKSKVIFEFISDEYLKVEKELDMLRKEEEQKNKSPIVKAQLHDKIKNLEKRRDAFKDELAIINQQLELENIKKQSQSTSIEEPEKKETVKPEDAKFDMERQKAEKFYKLYQALEILDTCIQASRNNLIHLDVLYGTIQESMKLKSLEPTQLEEYRKNEKIFFVNPLQELVLSLRNILESKPSLKLPKELKEKMKNLFADSRDEEITLTNMVSNAIEIRNLIIKAHEHLREKQPKSNPIQAIEPMVVMENDIETITGFNKNLVTLIRWGNDRIEDKKDQLMKVYFPNSDQNRVKNESLRLIQNALKTGDLAEIADVLKKQESILTKLIEKTSSFHLFKFKPGKQSTLGIVRALKKQIDELVVKEEKTLNVSIKPRNNELVENTLEVSITPIKR